MSCLRGFNQGDIINLPTRTISAEVGPNLLVDLIRPVGGPNPLSHRQNVRTGLCGEESVTNIECMVLELEEYQKTGAISVHNRCVDYF